MNHEYNKIIAALVLIVLGILFRTVFHLGDNVEFVTSGALLAAYYLGLGWGLIVPFITMMLSDLIIGNTNIFIFTWSAYAVVGVVGWWGLRTRSFTPFRMTLLVKATGMGIVASFWFYLWTNFGVWLLDSWGMYPKTLLGLVQAYAMGIPFLKFNLIGNIVIVPLSFGVMEYVTKYVLKLKRVDRTEQRKIFI